ncbi:MAG: MerR family transcriptional regulator [Chthoniobacteraceae bacterium]
MTDSLSVSDLAGRVNDWCTEHDVVPASGQAGERVSERNIRFYRTCGLLDAPAAGVNGYGERHFLQLVAIRLLQAQGLPLRKIRDLLFGRPTAELREVQKRGLAEVKTTRATRTAAPTGAGELWRMIPLDDDFLIVSRKGATISPATREALLRALRTTKQKH